MPIVIDKQLLNEVTAGWKLLSQEEVEEKIHYRRVEHIYPAELEKIAGDYVRKIPGIRKQLLLAAYAKVRPDLFKLGDDPDLPPVVDIDDTSLFGQLVRIKDKLACILKEVELREKKLVTRVFSHTDYYIDYIGGNDGSTGLNATGQEWKTIHQYTSVTVRSAGDRAFLRANITWDYGAGGEAANIQVDEDGTSASPIEMIGCDSVINDPWTDGSDVKPILDFVDANYYWRFNAELYWSIKRLVITRGSSVAQLYMGSSNGGIYFEDCDIIESDGVYGVYTLDSGLLHFKGCTLIGNTTAGILAYKTRVILDGCTIDASGTTASFRGLYIGGAFIEMWDTKIGNTTGHTTASVEFFNGSGLVKARNCLFGDATEVNQITDGDALGSMLLSEDHDQVAGASKAYFSWATVTRVNAVQLDGLDTAQIAPTSICSANHPASVSDDKMIGDYQIWCAAAGTTITIKARETTAWAADPSSSEFRLCASHLDGVSARSRTTVYSNDSLSGVNEVSFDVAFTPNAAGWVYVWWELTEYESGKSINVSVKPVVT